MTSHQESMILGFDPGREKCGVAVMGVDRRLYYHQVVPASQAIATLNHLCQQFPIVQFILGDQTTSRTWKQRLQQELVLSNPPSIVLVDERHSSLEARDRYWEMYPPKGLNRLLPRGLRQPPRPVDDIVAILLIERYFAYFAR